MVKMVKSIIPPEAAIIVIKTCSLIENGPGFSENVYDPILIDFEGRERAIIIPIGYDSNVATVEGIANGLVLNIKIEFADASRIFHKVPNNKTLKLKLGVDGSSVVGTMADT